MGFALALAEWGTALAVLGVFLVGMVLPALADQYTPARFKPLQARLRRHLVGEMRPPVGTSAQDAPMTSLQYDQLANLYPDVDPVTLLDLVLKEEAATAPTQVALLTAANSTELQLLLSEIDLYLGFVPTLSSRAVHVTERQYSSLVDFCALHYDVIRTPEAVFGDYGLNVAHISSAPPRDSWL